MITDTPDIAKLIPLGNSAESTRIEEKANDFKTKLSNELKTTEFRLQVDQTTMKLYWWLMFAI